MKLALAATALALGVSAPALAFAQYGATPQPYGSSAAPYGQQQTPYGQTQPQYGQSQQQPYGQTQPQTQLQAGGLAPPASAVRDQDSMRTEQNLQTAEQEDSGRGLEWFYVNAEIGVQHLGLQTFKGDKIVDTGAVSPTQTGLLVGAGMGVRLVFLTIGPRFRLANFSDFQLWSLDLEAAYRIPLGRLEPYGAVSAGYARAAGFGDDVGGARGSDVSVRGFDARLGGGLDYYVTPVFSVGANVSFDMLVLSRPAIAASKLENASTNLYASDGSSIGAGVSATAVLGLHF